MTGGGATADPIPVALPDQAVERFVESRRALLAMRAREAMDAISAILADPRISTHGLTYSQWHRLEEARRGLESVL